MNEFTDYEDFFSAVGDSIISIRYCESSYSITVEKFYQHFKQRLLNEIKEALE
jgi:hypothetical protein